MILRTRTITLALTLLWMALVTNAQEIGFTAAVDRNAVATGEYVKLTITLTGSQERFEVPSFGGLTVVQGPFENSSISIHNGRMSSSLARTWVLTGTAPGKFTIGPAKLRVGGGVIQTEPISIEVSKGAARPSDANASQGQSRDPNLFITLTLSKSKAFVGEQVVATYTLYSRYANIELSKYEISKMDGFWAEEIDTGSTSWEDQMQTVNGVQYRVAVLKRQVLFPQRSGQLKIAPFELDCIVNRTIFNRGSLLKVRSNAVEMNALALPANRPDGFNGAVGDLNMTVKADRTTVKANEALELTLTYSGRGNLKLIQAPALDFPNDFETYDPKVIDRISVTGNGMTGSRSFQYLVIPRHEGEFPLEPITFSYLDPASGKYRVVDQESMIISVSPGDGGPTASAQRPSRSDVQVLGTDIRYIRTGNLALRPNGHYLFGSFPWVAGIAAPPLAFLLFLGWRRRREVNAQDVVGMRRKRADRIARKRLNEAEHALRSSDRNAFYDAMGKALHGYLGDKFGLGPAETTTANIKQRFSSMEGGADVAEQFATLIRVCDMARFAPVEDRPRQQLYDEAASLIGRTEQLIRA